MVRQSLSSFDAESCKFSFTDSRNAVVEEWHVSSNPKKKKVNFHLFSLLQALSKCPPSLRLQNPNPPPSPLHGPSVQQASIAPVTVAAAAADHVITTPLFATPPWPIFFFFSPGRSRNRTSAPAPASASADVTLTLTLDGPAYNAYNVHTSDGGLVPSTTASEAQYARQSAAYVHVHTHVIFLTPVHQHDTHSHATTNFFSSTTHPFRAVRFSVSVARPCFFR